MESPDIPTAANAPIASSTQKLPERENTDASLRTERENTDVVLAERRDAVEADADVVVDRARARADAVLDVARERADRKFDPMRAATARTQDAIEQERALEDAILKRERAISDESLRRERATLAAQLPLERETTDRYLMTERVRSDDDLAHRDDFLGMVSHDLRNILSAVGLTAAQMASHASRSEDGAQTIADVKRIQRQLARMDRLISDLVDVTSIDAGKLSVTKASHHVAALLAEAADAFSQPASSKGVTLAWPAPDAGLEAEFDYARIFQVLANLVGNAIKFTPTGGTVEVRVRAQGAEILFSVKDTGIGIAPDMLEAVFIRFWQSSNDQRGLGLGLYIAKCIVESHGGRIWATSEKGKGSEIFFAIPLGSGERLPGAEPRADVGA